MLFIRQKKYKPSSSSSRSSNYGYIRSSGRSGSQSHANGTTDQSFPGVQPSGSRSGERRLLPATPTTSSRPAAASASTRAAATTPSSRSPVTSSQPLGTGVRHSAGLPSRGDVSRDVVASNVSPGERRHAPVRGSPVRHQPGTSPVGAMAPAPATMATVGVGGGSRLRRFDINFSVPVFYAGQVVHGQVVIELAEPMKIRGVRMKLAGKSWVYWSEKHTAGAGRSRTTVTRNYTNHETYFDHRLTLWGKEEGDRQGDNPVLPAGTHIYPFQFQLPHHLPSSYEGLHGGVRYFCKANIDKPWKFDHITKQAFTVISILDLNTTPQAASSAENRNEKQLCCLCCASGPITCLAQICRVGYVPGETIPIDGEIENKSKRELRGSKAILRERVYFHATSKTRTVSRDVAVLERGPIPPGCGDHWDCVPLPIPPLAPSELIGCAIIDIEYSLDIIVDVSAMAFDLVVSLPIIIGTIPMQTLYRQQQLASPPPPYTSPSPISSPIPPQYQELYPDLPPPSYQCTVFGETDLYNDDDQSDTDTVVMGSSTYCPMYTYYSQPATLPPITR